MQGCHPSTQSMSAMLLWHLVQLMKVILLVSCYTCCSACKMFCTDDHFLRFQIFWFIFIILWIHEILKLSIFFQTWSSICAEMLLVFMGKCSLYQLNSAKTKQMSEWVKTKRKTKQVGKSRLDGFLIPLLFHGAAAVHTGSSCYIHNRLH